MAKPRRSLPPEVMAAMAPSVDQEELRKNFAIAIAAKRDEAVKARKASGIEDTWMECEEAYLGIDDENRAEFSGAKWAKPTTMEGPLVRRSNSSDGVKSTAFVRVTARYVDAGAAKIGEITDPVDDKPFNLKPTPVPELIASKEDMRQVLDQGQPVMRAPKPEELPPVEVGAPADPNAPPPEPVPLTVADLAQHQLDQASEAAKKAEQRIYDWLVECGHSAQMRKVRFDAARLGSGVLKGPVPDASVGRAVTKDKATGTVTLQIKRSVVPVTRWVDLWNFYPDPACGEDIHSGGYTVECDHLSRAKLKALKGKNLGYDDAAIDKVLAEGPDKCDEDGRTAKLSAGLDRNRFKIWYFYGEITRAELALANPSAAADVSQDQDSVFAIVTLVNDTPIRTVLNPLDSGSFPYYVVNWRRRAGHWAGVGVAEQVRLPQRIVNAATRAMLNNAGKSAGSQIVANDSVTPADGSWVATPDKLYKLKPGADMQDVRQAFMFFQIPNTTPQLMSVIEYGFKLAEESSNVPLISQGQSGKTTPDTFSGQQLQDNNANQLLRDVGFAFADQITDPLVRQMYEWLLLDETVPDDEKGDYKVDCSAAMAMIERAIQDQAIMNMGGMVKDPAFGIDPKRWFRAMAKTKRLDPRDFQYSEEEQAKMDAAPPPPPLPIAVAQIRAESAEKIAASHDQATVAKSQADTDRDRAYVEAETERTRVMAEAADKRLELEREIANLKYQTSLIDFANRKEISLEAAKKDLAKTAMELSVQKELAHVDGKAPQVATPAIEPPGRAPDGMAFQK